jgi:ABC-type cobalamin transport system ATPase subunit
VLCHANRELQLLVLDLLGHRIAVNCGSKPALRTDRKLAEIDMPGCFTDAAFECLDVLDLADRIHILNYGRILAEGRPETVLKHPEVVRAYLGTAFKAGE